MIPLCIPDIGEEELKAVEEVLKSGWLAHGPKNKELEENFAKYIGVKKAVTLNSCTSALQLALEAYKLKGEVIVPSFTFVASANSIALAGCKPVFADINFDTCNIDPSSIREKITNKTVAIMPVHYAGHSADMKEIIKIADENNLKIIEDSAETIGGECMGKKTGSFGVGCFSFFPTKNLTTGEGGMITTNDNQIIERVNVLKAHGIASSTFQRKKFEMPWFRAASYPGYNMRLCDILAALGIVQLSKLDKMNDLRRKHSFMLNDLLNKDKLSLPVEKPGYKHVFQMYTIKLPPSVNRTEFINELKKQGIAASVHFDPTTHKQPFYKEIYPDLKLPITEDVARRIVTLPMYPGLKEEDVHKIADAVNKALAICSK